jgi:hypothetical protein
MTANLVEEIWLSIESYIPEESRGRVAQIIVECAEAHGVEALEETEVHWEAFPNISDESEESPE